ncbi:hypothetical protein P879_08941 [Paragonimus westermani]|uniref:Uncharacterized protein n=1 Tax=Paragonimus westermani TaxID=34504 RepID=A0A8T0DFA3_9TREM|nr:hypothetical protein P879_08941 [Paragonimus westermani]
MRSINEQTLTENCLLTGRPRGVAVAERLWSFGNLSSTEFQSRLDEVRCRMVRRGWEAEPGNGPGYCPP